MTGGASSRSPLIALMKHKLLLLLLTILSAALPSLAYDFTIDGLCYNFNSDDTTVTVTYERTSTPRYSSLNGNIVIPEKVTISGKTYSVSSIGDHAFSGCSGLTSVTIPNSVTSIGHYAFYYCSGLTSVTIPNSVTSIGNSAFSYCSGLTSVTIGNSVTSIGEWAFYCCSGLTSVTIPNSVTSIGSNAFTGCRGLKMVISKIENPSNVSYGLNSIPSSGTLYVPSASVDLYRLTSPWKESFLNNIKTFDFEVDDIFYSVSDKKALVIFSFAKGDIVIPNKVTNNGTSYTVTSIGNAAFSGCSGLTSVTIPKSITTIGVDAFSGCSSITDLTWNAVDCSSNGNMPTSNITQATIGNSVKTIPSNFLKDSKITSITIPKSITTIGVDAFSGCSSLTSVHISDLSAWCNIRFDNRYANPLTYGRHLNLNEQEITNLTIPNSVTSIGDYAFNNCSGLTSITIPNSVTSIGEYAFSNCSCLKSLTIPANVTSFGFKAFDGCSGITTLNYRAKALTNPGNILGMANVETVNFDGGATVVPANLLSNFSKLGLVNIGKDVTTIESGAFNNCSFAVMMYNAANCETGEISISNLRYLEIGTNVKSIPSAKAFYNCTGLYKIILRPTTPPTLGAATVFPENKYLAVAKDLVATYQSKYNTYGWKQRILPLPLYRFTVSAHKNTTDNNYKAAAAGSTEERLNYSDAGFVIDNRKVKATTKTTSETSISFSVDNIQNLIPGKTYKVQPYVVVDGVEYVGQFGSTLNVDPLQSGYETSVAPSSVILDDATAVPDNIKFKSATLTLDNKTYESYGNSIIVTGLYPNTYYNGTYSVEISEGDINSTSISVRTPSLSLKTQSATMLTNSSALLQSYTNLSEEETSCGFLWKRYDAPDEMLGNPVYCPVYDGMMMGTLKNLPEGNYYKYRSFYKTNDGTMYYGDWVAFYTGDATVEFEPVAHTYNNARVSGDNAIIQGVALRGSKDIVAQGFEYWVDNSQKVNSVPLDSLDANKLKANATSVSKINATGERMNATLSNLQAGKTYLFRAFVKTADGTTYGELRSFRVPAVEINGDINGDTVVNAGDVSTLYSVIMGSSNAEGDINADGNINAGDVSALYGIIMNSGD